MPKLTLCRRIGRPYRGNKRQGRVGTPIAGRQGVVWRAPWKIELRPKEPVARAARGSFRVALPVPHGHFAFTEGLIFPVILRCLEAEEKQQQKKVDTTRKGI